MKKHSELKIRQKTKVFGYPDAFHFRGSVIMRVALPVLLCTAWSVAIFLIYVLVPSSPKYVAIETLFIQIISLVLSLLLVFRTNTAYDRYWEGRRLWGTLIKDCRNLARFVWVGVDEKTDDDHREKKAAVKLILAYFISVKYHLRLERGIKDANDTVCVTMPKYGNFEMGEDVSPNLPVDISHLIAAYVTTQRKRETIDISQYGAMVNTLNSMIEVLTNLERILTSPIPFAYNVHLKQALYIYLILLPFQLVSKLNGWSIALTLLASFTLLGVESIGAEIEQPFGLDRNDLPLDRFCEEMRKELYVLMKKPRVELGDWELAALANHSSISLHLPLQEQNQRM
ncbi:Bestrophin/UPF0187 [Paraphysoderma sedebokerense]|nr:Bestrophin/UPF0187 [Paraphysoderma sedebokerense]